MAINHDQKSLQECNLKGPATLLNQDVPPLNCGDDHSPNKRRIIDSDLGLMDECNEIGIGASALCDPMQTGQIVQDLENPSRNVIYRYSKAIRGTNDAVQDLFRNVIVIDLDGKAWPVPIGYGTQERAVAVILQDNVRKDPSLVVDQIKLPYMSIFAKDYQFNMDRYTYHNATNYFRYLRPDLKPGNTVKEQYNRDTIFGFARGIPIDISYDLYVWTLYMGDMDQILEQVLTKFSPMAYIRVNGVPWEIGVKLNSIANNINVEPGDKKQRVIKFLFNFTAETYIPQPIVRKKAVLTQKIDIVDNVDEDKITDVYKRLEIAVKELEND